MKLKTLRTRNFLTFLAVAAVIGGIGSYFVFFSHAASSNQIYRLVNSSGNHIISTDSNEVSTFTKNGWKIELNQTYSVNSGTGTTPFYRMYNPTKKVWAMANANEANTLTSQGWSNQGIKFYSVKGYGTPAPYGFCRTQWIKLLKDGDRVYTPSPAERDMFKAQGYTVDNNDLFELDMACTTNPQPSNPGTGSGSGGAGTGSSGTGSSGTGTTTTPHTTTPSTTKTPTKTTPATTPSVSSTADASVTAGTRTAQFSIPAGGAQSVKVIYGTAADKLDKSSDTQSVSGSDTTILLKDLEPLTTYSYQVVRITNGQPKSSATATFKTTGYDLVLTFVDGEQQPVSDISGKIQNTEDHTATSDETGVMRFSDITAGSYTIEYQYQDHTFTETLNTDQASTDQSADGAQVLSVSTTIDVSKLTSNNQASTPAKKKSKLPLIVGLLLLLGIAGFVAFIIIRRRNADSYYYDEPAVQVTAPPVNPATNTDPTLHVGESLPDMVIKAMREEAARKQQHPPKDPPA